MEMARLYATLRGLMIANGDTQEDVARALKLGKVSVSHRMTGREPWRSDEMYILMDRYHRPYSELHVVFPLNGRNE